MRIKVLLMVVAALVGGSVAQETRADGVGCVAGPAAIHDPLNQGQLQCSFEYEGGTTASVAGAAAGLSRNCPELCHFYAPRVRMSLGYLETDENGTRMHVLTTCELILACAAQVEISDIPVGTMLLCVARIVDPGRPFVDAFGGFCTVT
jgi:hypothetical protein